MTVDEAAFAKLMQEQRCGLGRPEGIGRSGLGWN